MIADAGLGVDGPARVLEPGCGAGTFLGLAPPAVATLIGVELDPTTPASRDWRAQPPHSPDEHIQMAKDTASATFTARVPIDDMDRPSVERELRHIHGDTTYYPTAHGARAALTAARAADDPSRPAISGADRPGPSVDEYPMGTQVTVHANDIGGPGRRLGRGAVVDHPDPDHVIVESPYGTRRLAHTSHVRANPQPTQRHDGESLSNTTRPMPARAYRAPAVRLPPHQADGSA